MIKTDLSNGSLTIVLEAPKGNMIEASDIIGLNETIIDAGVNPEIKAIVITGHGHSFCAGLNICESTDKQEAFREFDNLLINLFASGKPIIAAVNGHSVGGGLLIQCCADYVVMSSNPKIKAGLPEVKIGLTIDKLMLCLLRHRANSNAAVDRLLLEGTLLRPDHLSELGFVDELCEAECLDRALKVAGQMGSMPERVYAATKKMLKNSTLTKMRQAFEDKCYGVFSEI